MHEANDEDKGISSYLKGPLLLFTEGYLLVRQLTPYLLDDEPLNSFTDLLIKPYTLDPDRNNSLVRPYYLTSLIF